MRSSGCSSPAPAPSARSIWRGSPGAPTSRWPASPTSTLRALERARSRAPGAKPFADPLRLIDEVEADAIIVASPAATHVEIGAQGARAKLERADREAGRAFGRRGRAARRGGPALRGLRPARPCAALFARSSAPGRDRAFGLDRRGSLRQLAPLPRRQPCRPLRRRRPDLHHADPRHRSRVLDRAIGLPLGSRPARGRGLSIADGGLRRARRPESSAICAPPGPFRATSFRPIAWRRSASAAASSLSSGKRSWSTPRAAARAASSPKRTIRCETNRIISSPACATARLRLRSICRRRSPASSLPTRRSSRCIRDREVSLGG